jgi:hypothetical protein
VTITPMFTFAMPASAMSSTATAVAFIVYYP